MIACDNLFLQDVSKVTDILTRHLYLNGDKLLEESTPIALSVNEMYAITRRLQLPRDTMGTGMLDNTWKGQSSP